MMGQGVVLYTAANIREEAALTAFLDAMAPAGQLVELSEKQIDAARDGAWLRTNGAGDRRASGEPEGQGL